MCRSQPTGQEGISSGSWSSNSGNIEWSSSEDDDIGSKWKPKLSKIRKKTPTAQKLQSLFPEDYMGSAVKPKLKVVKKSPNCQVAGVAPESAETSGCVFSSTECNETFSLNRVEEKNSSSPDAKGNEIKSNLYVNLCALKTPTKQRVTDTCENLVTSPIIGAQYKGKPNGKLCRGNSDAIGNTKESPIDESLSLIHKTSCNVKDSYGPCSPVLGTKHRQVTPLVSHQEGKQTSELQQNEDSLSVSVERKKTRASVERKNTSVTPAKISSSPVIGKRITPVRPPAIESPAPICAISSVTDQRNTSVSPTAIQSPAPLDSSSSVIGKRKTPVSPTAMRSPAPIDASSSDKPVSVLKQLPVPTQTSPTVKRRLLPRRIGKSTFTEKKLVPDEIIPATGETHGPKVSRKAPSIPGRSKHSASLEVSPPLKQRERPRLISTNKIGQSDANLNNSKQAVPWERSKKVNISPTISRKRIGILDDDCNVKIKRKVKIRNLSVSLNKNLNIKSIDDKTTSPLPKITKSGAVIEREKTPILKRIPLEQTEEFGKGSSSNLFIDCVHHTPNNRVETLISSEKTSDNEDALSKGNVDPNNISEDSQDSEPKFDVGKIILEDDTSTNEDSCNKENGVAFKEKCIESRKRCVFQMSQDKFDKDIEIQSASSLSQINHGQDPPVPRKWKTKQNPSCTAFDVRFTQEENEYGCIETQVSPTKSATYCDLEIEYIDLSFKNSEALYSKLSGGNGEAIRSIESEDSLKKDSGIEGEGLDTGSNWLRKLQPQTPKKISDQRDTEQNVESAKKRYKKNGYAARLKRLINSWQSEVQIWQHQLSMTKTKEDKGPKSQEKDVKLFSPGSVEKLIKIERNSKAPCQELSSPLTLGVRNLQYILESPQYSPVISKKAKEASLTVKKTLIVKILRFDKMLPSNAALCKVIYDGLKPPGESRDSKLPKSHSTNTDLVDKKQTLIFFNFFDQKNHITLCVGDLINIYSPWQVMDIPKYEVPILFASYFNVEKENDTLVKSGLQNEVKDTIIVKEETSQKKPSPKLKMAKKRITLMSWSCHCVNDSSVLPSVCNTSNQVTSPALIRSDVSNESLKPSFRIVKDISQENKQDQIPPAWTILEAIDQCGGVSEQQVTISIRAHRVISHWNTREGIKEWEVLGQDANGIFCSVKIPNRPLATQFAKVIEEGEGSTWTLTRLSVTERITDTQNPALFSMISSLHRAYQKTIKNDSSLYSMLADHALSTTQTYCYNFCVNLGSTEVLDCKREVVIPVSLPVFTLQEMLEVTTEGERGSANLNLLYRVGNHLYAMGHRDASEENGLRKTNYIRKELSEAAMSKVNSRNHKDFQEVPLEDFSKENTIIYRISVGSKVVLPKWIPKVGTVMVNANVREIALWKEGPLIDEYSVIENEKSTFEVCLLTLVNVLDALSPASKKYDLIVITGAISSVDTKTASSWLTCGTCGGSDVQEKEINRGSCLTCGQLMCELITEYYMEIQIKCAPNLADADISVELSQRLIKKLLLQCNEVEE
ncbi:hypothetical protein SK128_002895, partial [Halocaridina rubra]